MNILVIGSAGQDGSYLVDRLDRAGHDVYGITRSGLVLPNKEQSRDCNIESMPEVASVISEVSPDRVFYLAAYHHSSEEKEAGEGSIIRRSFAVHVLGLVNVLEAFAASCPKGRLFYAASSRVFGSPATAPQDEDTPFNPSCPYGISKTAGVQTVRLYRRRGLHCCAGFLYNHESERRPDHFVSQKIVKGVIAIERGQTEELVLGDLTAMVDWGYAPEYVEAMERILDLDEAGDFVIASGRLHSIQDFTAAAFEYVGLKWQDHVKVDPSIIRPTAATVPMVGDSSRLRAMTDWQPKTELRDLVRIMVDAERERSA